MKEIIIGFAFRRFGEKAEPTVHIISAVVFVCASFFVYLSFSEANTAEPQEIRFWVRIAAAVMIAGLGGCAFVSGMFVTASESELVKIQDKWNIEERARILNNVK